VEKQGAIKDFFRTFFGASRKEKSDKAPETDVSLRGFLLGFLDVLDSLDRLITLCDSTVEAAGNRSPVNSLLVLRRQVEEAFRNAGVSFMDCAGHPFDPERHEAMYTVSRATVADDTIVEVLGRGCEWRGRILRYARVVVARN
jgi:molecular chaperone GrpE